MVKEMVMVGVLVITSATSVRASEECIARSGPLTCVELETYVESVLANSNAWWNGERIFNVIEPQLDDIELGMIGVQTSLVACDERCAVYGSVLAESLTESLAGRTAACESALSECIGVECPACPAFPEVSCPECPACPAFECGQDVRRVVGVGEALDALDLVCTKMRHRVSGGKLRLSCKLK
jgi:hypothetical protein